MYKGVLRDDERRREKMKQREQDLIASQQKRELYERMQNVTRSSPTWPKYVRILFVRMHRQYFYSNAFRRLIEQCNADLCQHCRAWLILSGITPSSASFCFLYFPLIFPRFFSEWKSIWKCSSDLNALFTFVTCVQQELTYFTRQWDSTFFWILQATGTFMR